MNEKPNIQTVIDSVMAQLKSSHRETSFNTWF